MRRDGPPPAGLWERPEMLTALGRRDIAAVYRLLQRVGISQRRIAAMTGQSQSEISEILTGGRQVVSYDVLVRISEGLGVPRGRLGLAHDELTSGSAAVPTSPVLDPYTGRWMVRLPVFLNEYGAAERLAATVVHPSASGRSDLPVSGEDDPLLDPRAVECQWHIDARAVLTGRR